MSGIAGYLGPSVAELDTEAIYRTLSFTGHERLDSVTENNFLGFAVSHEADIIQPHAARERDGISVLLDGYVNQVDGKNLLPSRSGEALRIIAELYRDDGHDFARRLNGSFALAVYDDRDKSLIIVTDRLTSRPLNFIRTEESVVFSSRLEPFNAMGISPTQRLNLEGLIEFLVFARTLNSGMWTGQERVPPATVLAFRDGKTEEHSYWKFKFAYGKARKAKDEDVRKLAAALQEACGRAVDGFDSIGLLLSGGFDSRALLACLPESTICYTSCDYLNFETRVAAKAAKIKGCPHRLLKRTPHHYLDILPEAARINEGAMEYHHVHLVNLTSRMQEVSRGVMLHGLGLDFILRGHYLPRSSWKVAGRRFQPAILKDYGSLAEVADFLLGVESVRPDAVDFLVPSLSNDYRDYPRQVIRDFVEKSADCIVRPIDITELFVFRDLSRWLTFPLVECLRQYFPERWVAVDNSLVDIALTTPPETRFDSRLIRRALELIDPRMTRIPNSNTFLPIRAGSLLNATHRLPVYLYDHLYVPVAARTWHKNLPRWMMTTGPWHSLGYFWRDGPIAAHLEELLCDQGAMRDGVIDAAAVKGYIDRFRRGEVRSAHPLERVITFLEWRKACP
ncbi:MAG: hypothetical protein JW854_12740 [Actinobacteria bacterium]|nr:hypothetical protein [Actinomycetota bacterium]